MEGDARPWWRDGRVALLVFVTLLTLQVGWMVKSQCHDRPWDGYQWRQFCYSDVQALYGTRGAADGTWPYVESFNEYPPLTGLYMHAMGEITSSRNNYLAASGLGFAALAVLSTVLLGELVGRDRKVLYWAAAPALGLYAFYNWDLLAVAPTIAALLAFRKGRMGWAGGLLAIGASAKLYPAFLAPALGLWILRADGGLRARGLWFGLTFAAVWSAVHLPFFVLNADGMLEAYRFQAERGPNFETLWYAVAHLGREWNVAWMDAFDERWLYAPGSLLPFVAALGLSGWAAWTRRLDPVVAACLPVFAFLAFNKVFSLQYTLWAIPLLMLCPVPRTLKALVVVADLVVFVTLSNYFALTDIVPDVHLFTPAAFAAIFRSGVYAAVALHLVRMAMKPATATPAATGMVLA